MALFLSNRSRGALRRVIGILGTSGNRGAEFDLSSVQFALPILTPPRFDGPKFRLDRARIARLRAEGRSLREIATELGCSHALVHKSLPDSRLVNVGKSKA